MRDVVRAALGEEAGTPQDFDVATDALPEEVQRRLRDAGPRASEEGLALARELYAEAREKAAGVYVIPPFKQPEAALELLGIE